MNIELAIKPTSGSQYKTIAEIASAQSILQTSDPNYGASVKLSFPAETDLTAESTKIRAGLSHHGRYSVSVAGGSIYVALNTSPVRVRKVVKPAKTARSANTVSKTN
jgi:hypothetical protein